MSDREPERERDAIDKLEACDFDDYVEEQIVYNEYDPDNPETRTSQFREGVFVAFRNGRCVIAGRGYLASDPVRFHDPGSAITAVRSDPDAPLKLQVGDQVAFYEANSDGWSRLYPRVPDREETSFVELGFIFLNILIMGYLTAVTFGYPVSLFMTEPPTPWYYALFAFLGFVVVDVVYLLLLNYVICRFFDWY
jgi:hypothetical protein